LFGGCDCIVGVVRRNQEVIDGRDGELFG